MNQSLTKPIYLLIILFSIIFANSACAQDSCNRKWNEAVSEDKTAEEAFAGKQWQQATYAYQRLAGKWDDAAYSCSGKNNDNARKLAEDARQNSLTAQSNWDLEKCQNYTQPAGQIYASAKNAMQVQDWPRARDLYQRANEQFENASQRCNGQAARDAASDARNAAENAQRASENMRIKSGNDKTASCQPDRGAAFKAVEQASSAVDAAQFKTAVQQYGLAETLFSKLAINCQGQFSEDFTMKAKQAKVLKDVYASMAKAKK